MLPGWEVANQVRTEPQNDTEFLCKIHWPCEGSHLFDMFARFLHLIALLDKDAGLRWTSDFGCPWGARERNCQTERGCREGRGSQLDAAIHDSRVHEASVMSQVDSNKTEKGDLFRGHWVGLAAIQKTFKLSETPTREAVVCKGDLSGWSFFWIYWLWAFCVCQNGILFYILM